MKSLTRRLQDAILRQQANLYIHVQIALPISYNPARHKGMVNVLPQLHGFATQEK
jgi:hypothetical protein